ncbi:MAG: hypothetical protein K0Q66_694 [Chitinophagaceae bacterium]|jgi:hypothetical protein|nr:hypothetical protein [Chitinophagaceae bacterium]
MELDELKQALNQRMAAVPAQRSEKDIESLLESDTVSLVQKLRRSIWLEMLVSVAFTLFCAAMLLLDDTWVYNVYFSIIGVVGIAFVIVLYLLLRKTATVSASTPVKQNVESLVALLKEYMRRYLQLTLLLMPACFVFTAWLSYNDPGKVPKPVDWETIGYLSAGLLVVVVGFYYFTRWYLWKMYGGYVRQLERIVHEFDES